VGKDRGVGCGGPFDRDELGAARIDPLPLLLSAMTAVLLSLHAHRRPNPQLVWAKTAVSLIALASSPIPCALDALVPWQIRAPRSSAPLRCAAS